jgi:hypothetical protein
MSITRLFALVVGIVFLLVGILGFILDPTGGDLLELFAVNIIHNSIHVLVGIAGIAAAYTGWPRLYARILGIVYVVVGILAFIPALVLHGALLGLVAVNLYDNLLHLVVGLLALYVGFFMSSRAAAATA